MHACRLWQRRAEQCLIDMTWLEKYLITRGGRCKPTPIETTHIIDWPDNPVEPVHPCKEALSQEKILLEDMERLSTLALKQFDISLAHAIQSRFMRKETKIVKDWGDLVRHIVRVSKVPGLGLHEMDTQLRINRGQLPWTNYNDPDLHLKEIEDVSQNLREGLDLSEAIRCLPHR